MKKLNLPFAFLIAAIFLFHWPYLRSALIPIHDTLYVFTFAYPFYNEWYLYGQIAQWFPYSTYGLPANFYQAWAFTPVHYLVMLIGSLFRIEDALVIFKAGIVSEIAIYLLGFYWLSRSLYADKRTILLICLSAVASVVWYSNINVGFRFYYLFPLTAYFLVSFYKERRPEFIWMAGLAALFWWVQGSVLYHVMGGVFSFFIFLVFLFASSKNLWKVLFSPTAKNGIYFFVFVSLTGFLAFYYKQSLNNVAFYAPGRETESGVTTLSSFLIYGGVADWEKLFKGFFFASPPFIKFGTHLDLAIYSGVMPVVFFIWAILRVRQKLFLAFLVTAIALAWLSFGGNFAKLCYYFPGMAYYRHLGFMTGLVKVIVLICAGFGLDEFWRSSLARRKQIAAASLWFFFFMIILFRDAREDFLKHWAWINEKFILGDFSNPYAVMFLIGCIFLIIFTLETILLYSLRRRMSVKIGPVIFFLVLIFNLCDLFIFQGRIYDNVYQVPASERSALESLKVHRWEYQPVRTREAIMHRQQQAWKLVRLSPVTAKYATSFGFIQLDHCDPVYRPDIVTENVLQLVTIPTVKSYLIGCYYPKMRLISDMRSFDDLNETVKAIARLEGPEDPVLVYKLKEGYENVPAAGPPEQGGIRVTEFRANALTAEVNVRQKPGAWLVYDDAYHPRWRAEVNEKKVPVQQAYLAFKAVYVPHGKNTVRFFYAPHQAVPSIILIALNIVFALIFCTLLLRTLFCDKIGFGK